MMQSLLGNNRLIRTSVVRMFPPCFAATLAASITLMMDSLLAGCLISQMAIAAVAIGNPVVNVFRALVQTISSGALVKLTVHTGRGDREAVNRSFSLGVYGSFLLGLLSVLLCTLAARPLAMAFGGTNNPEAAAMATLYLQTAALSILFSSVNLYLGKVLAVYGYQREVFFNAIVSVAANLLFSATLVRLLPQPFAIAGLGLGTSIATLICFTVSSLLIKAKGVPVRLKLYPFQTGEMAEALKLGFPTSGNNLADGVIAGVINNIILRGFGGSATPLAVYTAVKGVASFAQATALGTGLATAPLFGILYGARDKNGLRRTLREGYKVGLLFTVIWWGILIAALPVLLRFYDMPGNPDARTGVYICFLFSPVLLGIRLMTQLFESTEKPMMGILYSVVPDSVIYPILLAVLLPLWQYYGIWLAYCGNGLVFLALLYLVRSLKQRGGRLTVDRMLCLDESIRDNVPMLDISIYSSNTDVTGISTQVHDFLRTEGTSGRTAYMTALCLEELAADFVAHAAEEDEKAGNRQIMDIKLFADENTLRVILRNAAKPYDPLDFQLDDETFAKVGVKMAQKVARNIDYAYVYKMNIVTIDLDK